MLHVWRFINNTPSDWLYENARTYTIPLDIDYYMNLILDKDQQEEIMDYFRDSDTDNISEAFNEFDGDYTEEELRLMRLQFHCKHGH